jgi:hypothetical protein
MPCPFEVKKNELRGNKFGVRFPLGESPENVAPVAVEHHDGRIEHVLQLGYGHIVEKQIVVVHNVGREQKHIAQVFPFQG